MNKNQNYIYIYNYDLGNQSIRQMETVLEFIKAEKIILDPIWKKYKFNVNLNYVYMSFNSFLEKYTVHNTMIFNILDGFNIIRKRKFNFKKKNLIFRPRGLAPEESYYKNQKKFNKLLLNVIEYIVVKQIDIFIYLNHKQQRHYEEKYPFIAKGNKITTKILPNYKKKVNIIPKKENDTIKLVYSGGFSKWQNIELIFELISDIINTLKIQVEFHVLTFEENFNRAYELANLYSISDSISIKYINQKHLDAELQKYDIGLIIRDDNIINSTASPFKVIDYTANGLSIILTDNIDNQVKNIYSSNFYLPITYKNGQLKYSLSTLEKFLIENTAGDLYLERLREYGDYIKNIQTLDFEGMMQ